jgi:fucose 4-O-acetylase-like acetyltransferase
MPVDLRYPTRVQWVDLAKGFGIILVVFGHVLRGLVSSGIIQGSGYIQLLDDVIYSFHMPLFFFISGMLLKSAIGKYSVGSFFFSKLKTLAYPFVVWSLLQGGMLLLLSKYTSRHVSVSDILSFPIHPIEQFWFLYALFFISITFFFIYKVMCMFVSDQICTAILLLACFVLYPFAKMISFIPPLFYILHYGFFFVLGLFFSLKIDFFSGILIKRINVFMLTACFILCQMMFHVFLSVDHGHVSYYGLVLAIISILFFLSISMFFVNKVPALFVSLGVFSMPIFLMHIMLASGFRIVLMKLFHVDQAWVHLMLGTLVGLVLPVFIISRFPVFNVLISPVFLGNRHG